MTGLRPRLTAEDILSRYAAGERTFSGMDLTGEKLRGADLAGIDLSDSDLRSTDLRDTNLSGANLTGCRMGRIPHWWLFTHTARTAARATVRIFDIPCGSNKCVVNL